MTIVGFEHESYFKDNDVSNKKWFIYLLSSSQKADICEAASAFCEEDKK